MTREEALQILDTIPTIGEQVDALEMAIKALEREPKRGHWLDKGDFYVCSECGKRMAYAVLDSERSIAYAFMSDYCPHCGSAMEVESDTE